MVIHHSNQLLEHLSEVEEKIKLIEHLMEKLNIDCDQEKLIKTLLAKKYNLPSGQRIQKIKIENLRQVRIETQYAYLKLCHQHQFQNQNRFFDLEKWLI